VYSGSIASRGSEVLYFDTESIIQLQRRRTTKYNRHAANGMVAILRALFVLLYIVSKKVFAQRFLLFGMRAIVGC